jgi:S-adenosylmethionine:tRNA ribosyltransferase-isomerase
MSDLDYELPGELIAQEPLPERDSSRMLLLDRASGAFEDGRFADLPELLRGDELIIVNNARVLPARLFGYRVGVHAQSPGREAGRAGFLGSRIEVLLLRRVEGNLWDALVRPGRKIRVGERLTFEAPPGVDLGAEVTGRGPLGLRQLCFYGGFYGTGDAMPAIERAGHMPLPPYIRRPDEPGDRERYQTVFARALGAVAAPTAGLHFTPAILDQIRNRGAEIREITLEVGLGTFQPVREERLEDHRIHAETYEIPAETAEALAAAKRGGRRVLAVGTTVVRTLEDAAVKAMATGAPSGTVFAGPGTARIFIRPGHRFAVVDQLLTNFHLPRSTLLALVASFAGREAVLAAYRHAVAEGYRFYSYGDCMLMR